MGIREAICFGISRRFIKRTGTDLSVDVDAHSRWRTDSLAKSWSRFSDSRANGKTILDFGCGKGELCLYLAESKSPKKVIGVDLVKELLDSAAGHELIEYKLGNLNEIPVEDGSIDTVVAFDCLEHVMSPRAIIQEWRRILKPGGRVLVEWYPYKAHNGPHLDNLVPVPWAHIIFGEEAVVRTAERIYDLPEFKPAFWDLDENGNKKPNKWKQWSV